MEVWEKVFLEDREFLESTHGSLGCVTCHNGSDEAEEKEIAHVGLILDPSNSKCEICHRDIVAANKSSLHTTLSGFTTILEDRGGNFDEGSSLATVFENHCQQCHTSCGQCHVSRPDEAGGGFISGHEFRATPSTQNNCIACHGSRVGAEYLGENEGIPADVHWSKANMTCTKCHGEELHGNGEIVATRYQNPDSVECEDCHQDILNTSVSNLQHQQHLDDLSCQVCHSVPYKNCYSCHVALDSKGLPCRTSDPSEIDFKIGLNPLEIIGRDSRYVVLRHVPTCVGLCEYYGDNLLSDFNNLPTWKYATPHNIQLNTPQNETCNSCHGNKDIFLTEDDVRPEELAANKNVVVEDIPDPR